MLKELNEIAHDDINDVFLQEFSTVAIFKSSTALKEIAIQFFEQPLDQLDTTYYHAWSNAKDVDGISKNDTLEINGVEYGIVDFSIDEFGNGINMFLQKV